MATVLVTKFRELTDVIMTLPVLYSACGSNPRLNFVLVTRPSLTSLFINAPKNLKVEGVDGETSYSGILGAKKLWKKLRNEYNPQYVVCLDNEPRYRLMVLMARLSGCKASVMRDAPRASQLTRRNNKVMLPLQSARARYREAFFRVGVLIQEHFQGIFGAGGKGDPSLFSTITAPPAQGERWIGIAPFAKHPGKAYPPEMMEDVLGIIQQELPHIRVLLLGGGETERSVLVDWAAKHHCAFSPIEARLGFPAELSLLSYLDVLVTMDSANMHLASIVGVPVITIWGATHPYGGYKGWHQKESDTISLPMPCRPCSLYGDKPCHRHDYHCLRAIKPRYIADKIIAVVEPARNNINPLKDQKE